MQDKVVAFMAYLDERWEALVLLASQAFRGLRKSAGIYFLFLALGVVLGSLGKPITEGWPGLIVGAILGAFAAVLFDWIPKALKSYEEKLPLRRILGPFADNNCVIYVMSFWRDMADPEHYQLGIRHRLKVDRAPASIRGTEYVVGEGDAKALTLIYNLLLKANNSVQRIEVNHRADLAEGEWGKNIVCIGAANQKTADVLAQFQNLPFIFTDNNNAITTGDKSEREIVEENGKTIEYQRCVTMHDNVDYGVIMRLKDRFSADQHACLIVAGLGAEGTAGAAYYLSHYYRDIAKNMRNGDDLAVLVEIRGSYQAVKPVNFQDVSVLSQVVE